MKPIILTTILLALTACQEFSAVKMGVASHGAQAADEALAVSLWTLCNATPVGAIKRRFQTIEDRAAYNQLCPEGELP